MLSPVVRGPRTILSVAGRSMVDRLASTTAVVPESSVRTKDELPGIAQHMENKYKDYGWRGPVIILCRSVILICMILRATAARCMQTP